MLMGRPSSYPASTDLLKRAWSTRTLMQHADLGAQLVSTGDARLVERTENDAYWGDGGDGSGEKLLGQLLMRVREELRAADRPERVRR